jgi:hypothetical protein
MSVRTRLLTLSLLVLQGSVLASPAGATHVVAGAKLGWTNSDLVGSNDNGISSENSALLGVSFGWEIKPWFILQLGTDLTTKGASLEGYSFGDLPTSVLLTTVDLPLLARFKYCKASDSRSGFYGEVGPSLGINTHRTLEYAGSSNNISDVVNQVDVGLCVGAGYDIQTGDWVTTLGVRYVIGLLDTFNSDAPRQDITGDLKNRALEVTIGAYRNIF